MYFLFKKVHFAIYYPVVNIDTFINYTVAALTHEICFNYSCTISIVELNG